MQRIWYCGGVHIVFQINFENLDDESLLKEFFDAVCHMVSSDCTSDEAERFIVNWANKELCSRLTDVRKKNAFDTFITALQGYLYDIEDDRNTGLYLSLEDYTGEAEKELLAAFLK